MQSTDQQKVAKQLLRVEINSAIEDSAKLPAIFKHSPHISKCPK